MTAIIHNELGMEPVFRTNFMVAPPQKTGDLAAPLMLPLYPPKSREGVAEFYGTFASQ